MTVSSRRSRTRRWKTILRGNETARSVRNDVQGLRALAVTAVILDHLLQWPSGGFVGVDVFFVISGFLITGLLLREWDRNGRISFVDFYRRRVRRIVPAALTVLVVSVAVAYFLFSRSRFVSTAWDAVASFFFFANWRLAARGTDYFQSAGPVSPLQHFWSLAVEEQFYLVWPWLMLFILWAVVRLRGRSHQSARILLGVAMGAIVVGTFGWSLFQSIDSPTVAYFSTFSRAWELGVGALLALGAASFSRIPRYLRPILAWIGLLGIFGSIFLINETLPFPAPFAAIPVVSTALVIAANTSSAREQARFLWPLTNPVAGYIGDISYSLYLWHFPIVIFGQALFTDRSALFFALSLALVLAISIWSYHFIEFPIHSSKLFERSRPGERMTDRIQSWARANSARFQVGLLTLLAPTVAIIVGLSFAPVPEAGSVAGSNPAVSPGTAAPLEELPPALSALQGQITNSRSLTSWPEELTPSIDSALSASGGMFPADIASCAKGAEADVDACTFGDPDAPNTMVVAGDSVAAAWELSLHHVVEDSAGQWKMIALAKFACQFTDLPLSAASTSAATECGARRDFVERTVAALHPALVIVSNNAVARKDAGGAAVTTEQWKGGLESILGRVAPNTGKTSLLASPPSDVNIAKCYTIVTKPTDCTSRRTSFWDQTTRAESEAVASINGVWVPTDRLFCTADGVCPAVVTRTLVKSDESHMTPEYAALIAPALREALDTAGLL